MQDLFNKIVTREIPAHIIWENETHLAFLDIKPIQEGHTLVIPKRQIDYVFDMQDKEYIELMLAVKQVAVILKDKLKCKRVVVAVEGFAVPHVHVHLVPVNSGNELNPELAKNVSEDYLETIKTFISP